MICDVTTDSGGMFNTWFINNGCTSTSTNIRHDASMVCIEKLELKYKLNFSLFFSPIAIDRYRCVDTINAPFKNDNSTITPDIKLYKPKSFTPRHPNTIRVEISVIIVFITILIYTAVVFNNIFLE